MSRTNPLLLQRKPARESRLLLAAAAVVLARWLFLALTGATFEDALISLRYAENLASGHGLVYNPGERVFGASTPLYVLFLAALTRVGLPALLVARVLGAVADGVTLYLWGRWLLPRRPESGAGGEGREERSAAFLLFAFLFGLTPAIVHVSAGGMETPFVLLLLTCALVADQAERPGRCGLALGGLMLLRPDGVLAAAVVLGCRWRREGRLPWRAALVAALVVLPWVVGAAWYFGTPVPHSIPAKASAYNLHRPSLLPNLRDTLAMVAPIGGPAGRLLLNLVLFPCLLLGLGEARRDPRLRPAALLLLVWWAFLVLPRTLLFTWYYPPLLLLAHGLAARGFAAAVRRPGWRPAWTAGALGTALAGVTLWLAFIGGHAARLQRAEETVRRPLGLWLRENTPPDARVAMEPIGYIGYYSRRRVLDAVGLVSPEMVPLNRAGAGWFSRMLREFAPDYVVERPEYLARNETLNSKVPMFLSPAEMEAFLAAYTPVASFGTEDLPPRLIPNYRFVIYQRRDASSARRWREWWAAQPAAHRGELLLRALRGPTDPSRSFGAAALSPGEKGRHAAPARPPQP